MPEAINIVRAWKIKDPTLDFYFYLIEFGGDLWNSWHLPWSDIRFLYISMTVWRKGFGLPVNQNFRKDIITKIKQGGYEDCLICQRSKGK